MPLDMLDRPHRGLQRCLHCCLPRSRGLLLIAAAASGLGGPALIPLAQAAAPHAKGGHVLEDAAQPNAAARETLQRINAYRAAGATCGGVHLQPAAPLRWNSRLEQAAVKHARDMAARRTMSHTGGDGSDLSARVQREAYAWASLGENVSAGYASVPEALAGWIASPGHCRNLMSPRHREVGVGAAHASGDSFGWYRTMVLGSPSHPARP